MASDLFAKAHAEVLRVLNARYPTVAEPVKARVEVVPARLPTHGDMATNVALATAGGLGLAAREVAATIVAELASSPLFDAATPAGPGFINLRLRPEVLRAELSAIVLAGEHYGEATLGVGKRVNVEYVSANPTGPLHVGHCRGAVVGDALANLLIKAGYQVTKEYYINDAGAQVEALAWAAYWRYLEALGDPIPAEQFSQLAPGGLQYQGEYLVPVGQELAARYGRALAGQDPRQPTQDVIALVRQFAVGEMMAAIRDDLALLGVVPDVFTSERALLEQDAADGAIARLAEQGLIYEGTLAAPKGKLPEDWEPRRQTLFRASSFGDETDRPLRKSDGSNTYFANDIAYHADKIKRGAEILVDVLGADHGGYVRRMQAAVAAISVSRVALEVVLCQIVHIVRQGRPVRMSKRAGNYITLRELLDEVGRDAVRFTMLTRKADAQMEFDLDRAVAQTRENPVFYVQYA
ncbi:MAG: arginine--tRNA ligase, partial [Acetobacteraceae bacterium]